MGKKKFIDKKRAVTFQLLARDSSDPGYTDSPGGDRVFVRVDNTPYSVSSFFGDDDANGEVDSRFADAPEDDFGASGKSELPEHVRKELLELGFPDDGYNYLLHLREIRNTGGGSAFYHNPKARLDMVPGDVKAYDASRLQISPAEDDSNEKASFRVASKTVNVKLQKVVDPDVAAMLDDSDLSRTGSDNEELEEDFVIRANLPDTSSGGINSSHSSVHQDGDGYGAGAVPEERNHFAGTDGGASGEQPRARRLLDEQFDELEIKEYGSDSNDDNDGYIDEEEEASLAGKLKTILDKKRNESFDLDDKYKGPADLLHKSEGADKEVLNSAAEIILRCTEYAEKYENGEDEVEVVVETESSDGSEGWDCETIVSTYSNLDNHPGKIEAPEVAQKKKLAQKFSGALCSNKPVISLKGKEKLPVDYLPHRKTPAEKPKGVNVTKAEPPKRKPHGQESKEEKKERKAAVKEERREARRMKKEMKGLYRFEAQRAQRTAAITGPSSVHLM